MCAIALLRMNNMSFDPQNFDGTELLHLAIDAANRDDHGQAITYLKAAQEKKLPSDEYAKLSYFLGAEYAQIGMYDRAVEAMQLAVDADPRLHTACFQLGLLHLTSGRAMAAREAWTQLALLEVGHPEHYLNLFKQGLEALADDDFGNCRKWLNLGMQNNQANPALNVDMQKMLDALPPEDVRAAEPAPDDANSKPEDHLFLSAYRSRDTH
jgi:tetratricopeptide (TPR) repeat protein